MVGGHRPPLQSFLGFQVFGEAADFEQLAHRFGEFRKAESRAFVMNVAIGEIDFDFISFRDDVVELRALHYRQTGVDGVSIKRSRKRARDDSFDSEAYDCSNRPLSSAAASKVSSCHENIEVAKLRCESIA